MLDIASFETIVKKWANSKSVYVQVPKEIAQKLNLHGGENVRVAIDTKDTKPPEAPAEQPKTED